MLMPLTSRDIKRKARELGFDACGIAPAADHPELRVLPRMARARLRRRRWRISQRSAERRADVRRVLPSAQTVIVTGTVYNTDRPVFDRVRRSATARTSRATRGATTTTT